MGPCLFLPKHLFFPDFRWELWDPFGNLQNPTQLLSYDGMNNQPLHLANIDISYIEISSVISFYLGMPTKPHPPFTTPQ